MSSQTDLKYAISSLEKTVGKKIVCVTGATGYVAGPIVQRLLLLGHTVHATCRNPQNESSVQHLKVLPNADSNLKLFKADLLEQDSFDEAIQGCDFVFHTASPFLADIPAGKEKELVIEPALKGTENVLNSVNKSESVKRVILTSSVVAVYGDSEERGKDYVFTEKDWTITASEKVLPYSYSKKLAEEKAWEMMKAQSRWDLVTICPGFVLGPSLSSRSDSTSTAVIVDMMKGMPAVPAFGVIATDIRVLAQAHCTATNTTQVPSDRYIVVSQSIWFKDMINYIREKYPKVILPKFTVPYFLMWLLAPYVKLRRESITHGYNKLPKLNGEKAVKIMELPEYDIKDTIQDMAEDIISKGLVTI